MQEETYKILLMHARKYPEMQVSDAVKLLYQNEFGSGHMIPDKNACVLRIMDERKNCSAEKRTAEPIGNGLARLYLQEANRLGISSESIGKMFMLASSGNRGNMGAFTEKLWTLRCLTQNRQTPFSADALDDYLRSYFAAGCPAVSHSEIYRQKYAPAYRLIGSRFARLLPIVGKTDALLRTQGRAVIALDGRCASGKSSAAALLAQLWNAPVIHMDDFFLPEPLRTKERFREAGGNIHYERFQKEVLLPLSAGKSFSYRIFDCKKRDYAGKRHIPSSPVILVEGAYSLHPAFGSYADASFFFDISPELQYRRLQRRNGEQAAQTFLQKWIPLENRYIQACRIDQNERIAER